MSSIQNPYIRWMIKKDLPSVLLIEELSFEIPWTEEQFCKILRQRNCIGMVIESNGHVAGFMIYELQMKKLVLIDIAIHPAYREKGLGKCLVMKLLDKLHHQRRTLLEAMVHEQSLAAQLFFKSLGFRATSIVSCESADSAWGDSYLMQYELKKSNEPIFRGINRISGFIYE